MQDAVERARIGHIGVGRGEVDVDAEGGVAGANGPEFWTVVPSTASM
jgi:hypothetical protein